MHSTVHPDACLPAGCNSGEALAILAFDAPPFESVSVPVWNKYNVGQGRFGPEPLERPELTVVLEARLPLRW